MGLGDVLDRRRQAPHGTQRRASHDEAETGDQHPGKDIAEIAAARGDAGEKEHPGCPDQERSGEWAAHAVPGDEVTGEVSADPGGDCEGNERETGCERPHAEHALQVERAEQEESEDRARGGQHEEEAAADGAIGDALDAEERCVDVEFVDREGHEARESAEAADVRLNGSPTS